MMKRIVLFGILSAALSACGGGDLPDTGVAVQASVDQPKQLQSIDPLVLQATAYSMAVGATSALNASGGTPPYQYAIDASTFGTLSGNIITGVAVGPVVASLTDAAGTKVSLTITIVAAPVATMVAPTTSTAKPFANAAAFKVLTDPGAGRAPLYQCPFSAPTGALLYFLSTSGCAGGSLLGYVYGAPVTGSVALHLYKSSAFSGNALAGGLSTYTIYSGGTSPPFNWMDAGVLGYVPQ